MALSRAERDALPPEHFAVPEKRKLPINDEKHTRMAWDMVAQAKDLSDSERSTARRRILARAQALGLATGDWHRVKAMSLAAMSLSLPDVPDHPNRMPFRGILTRIDEPSDEPPNGSFGKRVLLTRAAADKALPSLLGMAVDFTPDLDGHDETQKIGVITAATIEGNAIAIDGFFYASDFPNEVARIRDDKENLGFSFEAQRIRVESMEADPLVITECVFTGAAVLLKDKAAYQTTSLAASREAQEIDMDDVKKLGEQIAALAAKVADLAKKVDGQTPDDDGDCMGKVKPHCDRLNLAANAMEADGVGCHATRGQVATLRHMAGQMMAAAADGKVPQIYQPSEDLYGAGPLPKPNPEDLEMKKALAGIAAALANFHTELRDVQARSAANTARPERKTLPPHITALLARSGVTLPEGDGKLPLAAIDAALGKTSLDTVKRMEIKTVLAREGLLETA